MSERCKASLKQAASAMLVATAVGLAPALSQEPTKTSMDAFSALTPSAEIQGYDLPSHSGISSSSAADLLTLQRSSEGNPLWSIPLTSLSATGERPIFSRSRRAPIAAPAAQLRSPPVVSSQPRPQLALVGAILGEEDVAILFDQTTKNVARVRKGESYLGWTLQVLEGRKAILRKDPEAMILILQTSPPK